jgi:hypothetical protein
MPQADFGQYAINTSNADFHAAQPRNDMAELSKNHGFPPSEQLLPAASAKDAPANKAEPANKSSDTAVAAAPSADKPADAVPTHETYNLHPVSTIGNDTVASIDTPPTTAASSPVDTVDARPSVTPAGQPQQRPDAPPAPASAQPAPRNDMVG